MWNRRIAALAVLLVACAACSTGGDVALPAGGGPTAGGSPSEGVQPTVAESAAGSGSPDGATNADETVDHTFTIEDEDVDEILPAGGDAEVRTDLSAGTYTVICRFHVDQGMRATLEVR